MSASRYGVGGVAIGLIAASLITQKFKSRLPAQEALFDVDRDGRFRLGVPRITTTIAMAPEGLDRRVMFELAGGKF